jgi:PKD repeat protein
MEPWSIVHDVAVLSVEPSDDTVDQGQVVNITVVVRNEGTVNETFSVTTKYFNKIIETKTVTNLTRYTGTTLVFNWNTTGVPRGFDYEISAEASPITGETDTIDNIFVDGTITVETIPTPPVASFTFSPLTPYAGETVTFNASDSYDPDGTIVSYFWDFGDGTNGTGETTTHSFADTGTYPVTLNVTDNDGLTDTTSADVNVRVRADVNGDGIVDIFDVDEVSAHWYPGPPEGPLGYDSQFDLNDDGNIDISDIEIVSAQWGETT